MLTRVGTWGIMAAGLVGMPAAALAEGGTALSSAEGAVRTSRAFPGAASPSFSPTAVLRLSQVLPPSHRLHELLDLPGDSQFDLRGLQLHSPGPGTRSPGRPDSPLQPPSSPVTPLPTAGTLALAGLAAVGLRRQRRGGM